MTSVTAAPAAPALTLDQFAHFDRCLFPGDLERDLVAVGLSEGDAHMVAGYLSRNRCGVVRIYQEFIGCEPITTALNALLAGFVKHQRENG